MGEESKGEKEIMEYGQCVECNEPLVTGLNGDQCLDCLQAEQHKAHAFEENAKYELKHAMGNALNMVKGFDVGWTSRTHDAIAVEHEGVTFIVKFELANHLTLEGAVNSL